MKAELEEVFVLSFRIPLSPKILKQSLNYERNKQHGDRSTEAVYPRPFPRPAVRI